MAMEVDMDASGGHGSQSRGTALRMSRDYMGPGEQVPAAVGAGAIMPGGSAEKICGVCGDRAIGYNFDAVSCESCKAFFRRNAPKGLDHFKCLYDQQCRMDLTNRRFCKHCRLSKCFEIGMKREYILTAEEKAQKRMKIEQNRVLREMEKQVVTMKVDETSTQTIPLTPEQASDIEELMRAYRASLDISTERDLPRDRASGISDLVNIAELSVRRVIAMAKQVSAFRALQQVEQIQLLKGGSIELLILRSVLTFDPDKQQFLDPTDSQETRAMKVDQLQNAVSGTGLFDAHMAFVRSVAIDLQADETMLVLLLVISLFSPDRASDEGRAEVTRQQEHYTALLQHYLSSRLAPAAARVLFPRLLLKLTEIRSLSEEHSQVLLRVNTNSIQPLMIEVLSLES